MSYLHCAGWAWLAIWVTVLRVVNQVYYERIASAWLTARKKAATESEAARMLTDLVWVFRWCGWCGYGLLAITILPSAWATAAYWVEAFALLVLVYYSRRLARSSRRVAANGVFSQLKHGQQLEDAAEKIMADDESIITAAQAIEEAVRRIKERHR